MNELPYQAGGLQIDFLPSNKFETPNDINALENNRRVGRNVLRLLMMGWQANWKDLLSWQVFKAIFVERDHGLTQGMRYAFQEGFDHVFTQLQAAQKTGLNHAQNNQAELYIKNCLTLLPFADLTLYESFRIPRLNKNGEWEMVEYKVTPIELTPTSGLKKLLLSDNDRVFAYGLEPMNNTDAEPLLIFMGSTYPSGQGFWSDVETDMKGGETVGRQQLGTGEKRLDAWMDRQNNKVQVCGTSLGGSLALQWGMYRGEDISRVDALNPAGLHTPWFRKSRFDRWDDLTEKPEIIVQRQGNDPVSRFGGWKDDWTILQIDPPADVKGPIDAADHALNYAGFIGTTFNEIDAAQDNLERKKRDFWVYTFARTLVYYAGIVPFIYGILPVFRYINNHKTQIAVTAALATLMVFFPILTAGLALPMLGATAVLAVNVALAALVGGYLLTHAAFFVKDLFTGGQDSHLSKFNHWFAKQSLTGKILLGAAALAVLGLTLALVLTPMLPVATPAFFLAVASLPLVIAAGVKVANVIATLFGFNEVETAECQDPNLPRNRESDIYANETTVKLSAQEIADYYAIKDSLIKQRDPLKTQDRGRTRFDGKTKQTILSEAKEPDYDPTKKISVTGTKAKVEDMKETVRLLNKFGLNAESAGNANDEQKDELHGLHASYKMGKVN